jgi:hypothetical protein
VAPFESVSVDSSEAKARRSFLKKRTKKLLLLRRALRCNANIKEQKFLLLFSKRSAFFLPMVRLNANWYYASALLAFGVAQQIVA